MFRKYVLALVVVVTFGAGVGLAMKPEGKSYVRCDLEWSNYGLNFEWYNNSKLVKALELSSKQEEEMSALIRQAAQAEAMGKEISAKEAKLRDQIGLVSMDRIKGRSESAIVLADIISLLEEINKIREEQYKTMMVTKAKLKMLLTAEQKEKLYRHFKDKETEQKNIMKERMRGGRGRRFGPHGFDENQGDFK